MPLQTCFGSSIGGFVVIQTLLTIHRHCLCACWCACACQAGIFQNAKKITDAQAGESVVDTVIAVPVWMGIAQRQAIMDAARLAGLNVLGLVNTHAAAALQFGIERDFTKKEQTVSAQPGQAAALCRTEQCVACGWVAVLCRIGGCQRCSSSKQWE